MDLIDIMLKRRSIRNYKNEDIPEEVLKKIIDAGLLAPTSRNRQPCEIIVVKDKDILEKLSKSKKSGSLMLADCNTALVVIADNNKADTWIEDSSIMLTYMDLMAAQEGVGSCWCQIHLRYSADEIKSEDVIRDLFELEDNYRIVGILSLGIADKDLDAHKLEELDYNKIRYIN